jgi:predicted nucleotidyltransferase
MGLPENTLLNPNDILATEYCKAILTQSSAMEPLPILREGNYHDTAIDMENPSASALREQILSAGQWLPYVPEQVHKHFQHAVAHSLSFGEQAILYRLRTMCDGEFESLPYGSEGLWRKLMHSARKYATLEEIIAATKSKRYTRTRIDRMILCAFLGITEEDIFSPAPYTRVLAFNDRGREVLKNAKKVGQFPNAGEVTNSPYEELENRAGLLYSLFANVQESPAHECDRRVYYQK